MLRGCRDTVQIEVKKNMIVKILRKINFLIPICAMIVTWYAKNNFIGGNFLFSNRTPLYFNYWVIYLTEGIILSLIMLIMKKIHVNEAICAICLDLIMLVVMIEYMITTM